MKLWLIAAVLLCLCQTGQSQSHGYEWSVAADGRCCIEHAFDPLTRDWLEAYTAGENPAVVIADTLPGDWYAVPEPK